MTAFITHPDCLLHDVGSHHPESPARLRAIQDQLISNGLMDYLNHVDAPQATLEQLARVHPMEYIESLQAQTPEQGLVHTDPDTAMTPHTLKAALRSAGAAIQAVDMVMDSADTTAFCAIRPPGHHAERAKSMGFCYFNNVAVGIRHAIHAHGLSRVAIIDTDVHHGNGTEEIFANDPHVLMCSIFQHPFYPYCGTENPAPNMVNVPMKAGSKGADFRTVVEEKWLPALHDFKPEMIFISAGFDAHREDEMGSMGLVEADYGWVTEKLVEIANLYSQGRIVSVLEGGYDLSALARSVVTHIRKLGEF